MRRPRLLLPGELAVILLFALAGILVLAGRRLYGEADRAAVYGQVRTLADHLHPWAPAAALVLAIIGGGWLLCLFRRASPLLFGVAQLLSAGVAGTLVVLSFGRRVLHEPDGSAVDMGLVAAFAGFCVAVFAAVDGWDTVLRAIAARRRALVPSPAEPAPGFGGLLTPASMARAAAQLALQLANYAAADAARQEAEAAAAAGRISAAAEAATRDAEAARMDATGWAASRTAQASASLAIRNAAQG